MVPAAENLRSLADRIDLRGDLSVCDPLDLDAAADMLDTINALHVRWDDCPWDEPEPLCRDCQMIWPCNTHRILHPEEGK